MKWSILTIIVLWSSCSLGQEYEVDYAQVLRNLGAVRSDYQEASASGDTGVYTLCSKALFKSLSDSIFRAWYGTQWDFNGISNTPGHGTIACGYFVSTTLKHAGFNLNRYRLAQQDATTIARSLGGSLKRYSDRHDMIDDVTAKPTGLYVVGLDYHVGFLVVVDYECYFVHSDFINDKVVSEEAEDSPALIASNHYVITELTDNEELMKKWLNGSKIF